LRGGIGGGVTHGLEALAVFDEGDGEALFVGGDIIAASGTPAKYVARWRNQQWTALGSGLNQSVRALTSFDDGIGEVLYAGGLFSTVGGLVSKRLAAWDGESWTPFNDDLNDVVYALQVFNDGNGPALYVGGRFTTAGGVQANRIARWSGTQWTALGLGIETVSGGIYKPEVNALAVFGDGNGEALYAGGKFMSAGGILTGGIAR